MDIDVMKNEANRSGLQPIKAEDIRRLRKARRESQSKFWKRFGVTQSRGSRFEQGLQLPVSVAILVKLYFEGVVNDGDLWRARRGAGTLKQLKFFNHISHN